MFGPGVAIIYQSKLRGPGNVCRTYINESLGRSIPKRFLTARTSSTPWKCARDERSHSSGVYRLCWPLNLKCSQHFSAKATHSTYSREPYTVNTQMIVTAATFPQDVVYTLRPQKLRYFRIAEIRSTAKRLGSARGGSRLLTRPETKSQQSNAEELFSHRVSAAN